MCLSLPAVIKAKEIHAQLRHANAVARSIPGTHVLVQSAAPPGQPVDEDEEDEKQADMGMFGNSGPDAKSKATSPMLFCGFITKQGWIRKSWKRRFFVLHANGMVMRAMATFLSAQVWELCYLFLPRLLHLLSASLLNLL